VGKETTFIEGLRVTDEETMEIAEMVLNKVNKDLVRMLEQIGMHAIGISGKDGGMLRCEKKTVNGQEIGYVGNVVNVDTDIVDKLLEDDYIPIIAPIGLGVKDYHSYNINADDAASSLAKAMKAEKLAFLTDIEGVCTDPEDKSTLISTLTVAEAGKLIEDGYIKGGMLPKLRNCIEAVEQGVQRVHIIDGRKDHCLLLEFFTNKGVGTAILNDEKGWFDHE
jgi:acetylglutamate kinase